MRKPKNDDLEFPPRCQTYYIDGLSLREIIKDAEEDDRSRSYSVNKIIREYYVKKGRLEDRRKKNPDGSLHKFFFHLSINP